MESRCGPLPRQASPVSNTARDVAVTCEIAHDPGPDGYVMTRPAPGKYLLHFEIDENRRISARFPGDDDGFFPSCQVTADAPAVLRVDVPKLMRQVARWDDNKSVDGNADAAIVEEAGNSKHVCCSRVRVPATVTFKWNVVSREERNTPT